MSDDIVIEVNHLWKRYGLPLYHWLRRVRNRAAMKGVGDDNGDGVIPSSNAIWALKDISFSVRRGETIGVIGYNGAGKSTLLKVLAGVTPPTRGQVMVVGRVFPMIELNAGVHPELTGRENVFLLGAIMGLSRRDMEAKLPEIEDFTELGEWFNRPIRTYSSGMLVRLGFSVAVNVDADILLVDEVLAVGDITFQRKCFDKFERMRNGGKTLIFVSHSIRQVERLCDRTIVLDRGNQVAFGKTIDSVSHYYQSANLKILHQRFSEGQEIRVLQGRMEDATVDIVDVRFLDAAGQEALTFRTGGPLTIEVTYRSKELVRSAIVGFGIETIDSFYISGFTSEGAGFEMNLDGEGKFRCTIPSLPLLSGIYTIRMRIRHPNGSIIGGGYGLAAFNVQVPNDIRLSSDYGVILMEPEWEAPTAS